MEFSLRECDGCAKFAFRLALTASTDASGSVRIAADRQSEAGRWPTARRRGGCPGRSRAWRPVRRRRRRRRSGGACGRGLQLARAGRGAVPGRRRSPRGRPPASARLPSTRIRRPASSTPRYSTPPSIFTPLALSVARWIQPVVLPSRAPGLPGLRCSSQTWRAGGSGRARRQAAAGLEVSGRRPIRPSSARRRGVGEAPSCTRNSATSKPMPPAPTMRHPPAAHHAAAQHVEIAHDLGMVRAGEIDLRAE